MLHFRAEYAEGVEQHSPGSPRTRRTPVQLRDGNHNPNGVGQCINRTKACRRDGVQATLPVTQCRTSLRFQNTVARRSQGAPFTATLGYVVQPLRGEKGYVIKPLRGEIGDPVFLLIKDGIRHAFGLQ